MSATHVLSALIRDISRVRPRILRFGLGLIVLLGLAARPGAGASASQPAGQRGDSRADRVIVDKRSHRLTLWRGGKALKSYRVALGSGGLAPKVHAGDNLIEEIWRLVPIGTPVEIRP